MKIPENIFNIACYYLMVVVCGLAVIMLVSQLFLTQSILGITLLLIIVILAMIGLAVARKEVRNEK